MNNILYNISEPKKLFLSKILVNTLIGGDRQVGYELKYEGEHFYVYKEDFMEYMREVREIANVEYFSRKDVQGLNVVDGLRSKRKNFSLNSKDILKKLDYLQRLTWHNEIDINNQLQLMFTTI